MISHEASISPLCSIGAGVVINPFSVVCEYASIGYGCNIGHNVFVGPGVVIGHSCRIQGNVFIPKGTTIGCHTFIGPGSVFCNVKKPEPEISQKPVGTAVSSGVIIGAGVVILPGISICEAARIGAGAVVTKPITKKGVWYVGNPAHPMSR